MTTDVNVPLLDLKAQYDTLREEIEPVVREVVESQWFIMGPKVKGLEEDIARYVGVQHAVGCASGTDAILVALMALGIGPKDQVICPSYTFFATGGSIHRLGATPVFADIDPVTYQMDVDHVRELAKSCPRLKAIMPVHLFGMAADMDAYVELGRELGVPIVEDAAQAIGTRDATGTMAGSRGAIGCFSFFPSKNLGGFGDGGMITTSDDQLAATIRMCRGHGGRDKYHNDFVGGNFRLDTLQAAVLLVKLRHLDDWSQGRRENAARYDELLADVDEVTTPTILADNVSIYNQYVIRAARRDELQAHLKAQGVGNAIYYPVSLHQQDCFAALGHQAGDFPESEKAAAETLALPVFSELTDEQLTYVVDQIKQFYAS